MMGAERRSLVMSEEEKRLTAYHEAGHALVAVLVPEADPLHKVTIIPRGLALGLTQQLPLEDRYTYPRSYLEANLQVLMGGRLAEELIFGEGKMTTGAGNDLERATELARKMVCEWGMSPAMGPLTFGKREESIFLGKEFARHQDYSETTATQIDDEIRKFITIAYEEARDLLNSNQAVLEAIAGALLEDEVLDGDRIYDLLAEHSDVDIEAIKRLKQKTDGEAFGSALRNADEES
jgi:cell division protease FtsH